MSKVANNVFNSSKLGDIQKALNSGSLTAKLKMLSVVGIDGNENIISDENGNFIGGAGGGDNPDVELVKSRTQNMTATPGITNFTGDVNATGTVKAVDFESENIISLETAIINLQNSSGGDLQTAYDNSTSKQIETNNGALLVKNGTQSNSAIFTVKNNLDGNILNVKNNSIVVNTNLNLSNKRIQDLSNPVNDNDAVNLNYLNQQIANIPSTDLTELEQKTVKLDTDGNINESITTNQTVFNNDQELVSKKYVNDTVANIPSTDLTELEQKTAKLDTDGNINQPITTNQTTFNNNQELVSKKYVNDTVSDAINGGVSPDVEALELKTQYQRVPLGSETTIFDTLVRVEGTVDRVDSTAPDNGSFVCLGGVGIALNLNVGGNVNAPNITELEQKTVKLDANGNIIEPITTNQTTFNDQELVSKKYVNDSISAIPPADLSLLEEKTANIILAETDETKTTFQEELFINRTIPTLNFDNIISTSAENVSGNISDIFNGDTTTGLTVSGNADTQQEIIINISALKAMGYTTGTVKLWGLYPQRATNSNGQSTSTENFETDGTLTIGRPLDTMVSLRTYDYTTTLYQSAALYAISVNGVLLVNTSIQENHKMATETYVDQSISNIPPTDLSSLENDISALQDKTSMITDENNAKLIITGDNSTFQIKPRGFTFMDSDPPESFHSGGLSITGIFQDNGTEYPLIGWSVWSGGDLIVGSPIKYFCRDKTMMELRNGGADVFTKFPEDVICDKNLTVVGDIGSITNKVPNIHCENLFYTQTDPVLRTTENQNVNVSDTFLLLNNKIETKTAGYTNENGIIQIQNTDDISLTSSSRIFYTASLGHFFQGAVSGVSLKFMPKAVEDIEFDEEHDHSDEIAVYLNTDGKLHIKKRSDGSDNELLKLGQSRGEKYKLKINEGNEIDLLEANNYMPGLMSKDDKNKLDNLSLTRSEIGGHYLTSIEDDLINIKANELGISMNGRGIDIFSSLGATLESFQTLTIKAPTIKVEGNLETNTFQLGTGIMTVDGDGDLNIGGGKILQEANDRISSLEAQVLELTNRLNELTSP